MAETDKDQPVDKHPEKRMRQAWNNYVDEKMPEYRKENPTLKRSQLLVLIGKEWKKDEKNPFVKAKLREEEEMKKQFNKVIGK